MGVVGQIGEGVIQIAVAGFEAAKAKLEKLRDAATDAGKPVDVDVDAKSGKSKTVGKADDRGGDRGTAKKTRTKRSRSGKGRAGDKAKPPARNFDRIKRGGKTSLKKPAGKTKPAGKGRGKAKPPKLPKLLGMDLGGLPGMAKMAGPLMAVGAALAAAGVAAKVFSETLSTINSLVKRADPRRYAIFEATLESTSVILGRQFIPLLQVAQSFMERVNAALRGLDGGGLAKFVRAVAVALERVVNAVWPAFEDGLRVVDDLFNELTPVIEELGGLLEEVFGGFAQDQSFGTMLRTVAGYFVQLMKTVLAVGSALWDAFGPILRAQFTGFNVVLTAVYAGLTKVMQAVQFLAGVMSTLWRVVWGIGQALWDVFGPLVTSVFRPIADAVRQAYDALVGLWGVVEGIGSTMRAAFRDAVYSLIGGINMVIQAINRMIEQLNRAIAAFNRINPGRDIPRLGYLGYVQYPDMRDTADRRRPPPGAGDRFTNTPLPTRKPEFVGIEEAFKKAQVGAALDPARIAERERLGLARDQLAATREVAANTRGRPAAEGIF